MLKINETPVRTSKNFNINNVKLDNINIPEDIGNFNNVQIVGETSKVDIDNKLTYGLSNFLEKQVENKVNQEIDLEIEKDNKQINFKFDESNLNLVDSIKIVAKENSKATVTIKYESTKNIEAYHNGIINVYAKANSEIHVVIVNLMNSSSNNFIAIQNTLEENAKVNYCIVDFGGKNSITNYYSNLIGKNSDNNLNAIYLGSENQLFDLNYIGELRGEKSNINIEVKGVFNW